MNVFWRSIVSKKQWFKIFVIKEKGLTKLIWLGETNLDPANSNIHPVKIGSKLFVLGL